MSGCGERIFDGGSYHYKYHPFYKGKSVKSMTWRQWHEGLELLCTAKVSHTGSGGRITYFIVVICFNERVILCEQYFEKISGEMFGDFIHKHSKEIFEKSNNPKERLFRILTHSRAAESWHEPRSKCV